MRNCDKCSKEELITATGVYSHPAVVNGKPISCGKTTCNVCDLHKTREGRNHCGKAFISWLYSEADPEKEEDKGDPVNHPSHYTDGKIEVIDYIEDKGLDFCLGNAVKYISRAGRKDQSKEVEDLQKAIWYINRKIEQIGKEESEDE